MSNLSIAKVQESSTDVKENLLTALNRYSEVELQTLEEELPNIIAGRTPASHLLEEAKQNMEKLHFRGVVGFVLVLLSSLASVGINSSALNHTLSAYCGNSTNAL